MIKNFIKLADLLDIYGYFKAAKTINNYLKQASTYRPPIKEDFIKAIAAEGLEIYKYNIFDQETNIEIILADPNLRDTLDADAQIKIIKERVEDIISHRKYSEPDYSFSYLQETNNPNPIFKFIQFYDKYEVVEPITTHRKFIGVLELRYIDPQLLEDEAKFWANNKEYQDKLRHEEEDRIAEEAAYLKEGRIKCKTCGIFIKPKTLHGGGDEVHLHYPEDDPDEEYEKYLKETGQDIAPWEKPWEAK